MGDAERFWLKVDKTDTCWLWTAGTGVRRNGAMFGKFKVSGRTIPARRYSWELANGPIPDGARVAFSCGESLCVNPEHMTLDELPEHGGGLAGRKHCKCQPCVDRYNEYRRGLWRDSRGDPANELPPLWVLYNGTPTRDELMAMRDVA